MRYFDGRDTEINVKHIMASGALEPVRNGDVVRDLAEYGCLTRMHVVRLLAPRLENEDHTKDIDFSPSGIRMRWEAGYAGTQRAIERAPWLDACDHSRASFFTRRTPMAGRMRFRTMRSQSPPPGSR
jgi:hypothetical protein